jgi:hypothetical protein
VGDPRIYQVLLGDESDARPGLAVARQLRAAGGKPPAAISVWASLAPSTVVAVAALLPHEIVSADIALEPSAFGDLAEALREEPRVHNWHLSQRGSAFGSPIGVGTPHPAVHDGSSSVVSFDFGGDPVPEAIENGRFRRWLDGLAGVGLLPAMVSAARLMDTFAATFPPRKAYRRPHEATGQRPHEATGQRPHEATGQRPHEATGQPPHEAPGPRGRETTGPSLQREPFREGGVQVSARGWRTMRGDRDQYWPGACQIAIPADPATALDRAAPLFKPGGPVEFHGYYRSAILGKAGLASRLAAVGSATFVLHTSDSDGTTIDEATVDELLAVTGDDLVCVDWRCDWPDAVPGHNGVQLTVNGVGNLHEDDPEHVPGAMTLYLTVHPRGARGVDNFADRLAGLAGIRLTASR